MAVKEQMPELLEKAKTLLLVPDYFHFLLTGKMCCEYTNATTTQLVNVQTKDWTGRLLKSAATLKTYFLRLLSRAMFWEISLRKYKKSWDLTAR